MQALRKTPFHGDPCGNIEGLVTEPLEIFQHSLALSNIKYNYNNNNNLFYSAVYMYFMSYNDCDTLFELS